MKTLFKNGTVINVFTGELEKQNVLIEDDKIIGVDNYLDCEADIVKDVTGKYICPGFIDGHIHVESTMLLPAEFARVAVPRGTTTIVADPHEIANVCGKNGVRFMLKASENLPMTVYLMIPSCVPATQFDESGANLDADDIDEFLGNPRVLGLGEVMNYPGVIQREKNIMEKIDRVLSSGLLINGHAPLLCGKALDRYIAAGISDDHECSSFKEAAERIRKGQRVMIRQGTAARNLAELLPLFKDPFAQRCLLVSDDKHPADLLAHGHIDDIIRQVVKMGEKAVTGIRMATLWATEYFGLKHLGAIAPGYTADLLVLNELNTVQVDSVYKHGKKVAENGICLPFEEPIIPDDMKVLICKSFHMESLSSSDFTLKETGMHSCHVIKIIEGQLITEKEIRKLDFDKNNGIDISNDLLKIAVIERHRNTGHMGLGFIHGIGLTCGAIASSVSHDSHNLIIIGTDESDMAFAANRVRELGGGAVFVVDGKVIAEMPLPYAGLMSEDPASKIAEQNENLRKSVYAFGVSKKIEPFMTMAFIALSVIPHIKITTTGLIDVDKQERIPLFWD